MTNSVTIPRYALDVMLGAADRQQKYGPDITVKVGNFTGTIWWDAAIDGQRMKLKSNDEAAKLDVSSSDKNQENTKND